ncbi:hypothetical protein Cme02nite_30240 [Catellatospora methionotrophica]|uniref:Uncharacterized protein n=1 Tax=Catellatospora methionotrophica TaxID=121620 RepID=A0A8J3L963_9ACTN|nr:hypothetical protein Cme02nite_30240 [Catellatospora methionotrophica]
MKTAANPAAANGRASETDDIPRSSRIGGVPVGLPVAVQFRGQRTRHGTRSCSFPETALPQVATLGERRFRGFGRSRDAA